MTLLVCVPTIFDFQLSVGKNEVVRWKPQAPFSQKLSNARRLVRTLKSTALFPGSENQPH